MAKKKGLKHLTAGGARLLRGDHVEFEVFRRRRVEMSRGELQAALVRPVEALLRTVCRWGDAIGDDWDLGDYRFLILDYWAGDDLCLYVQFWSEPKVRSLSRSRQGSPTRRQDSLSAPYNGRSCARLATGSAVPRGTTGRPWPSAAITSARWPKRRLTS